MSRVWLAPILLAIASCSPPQRSTAASTPATAQQPSPANAPTAIRVAHQPPSAKDEIEAAIASSNVALSTSSNCASAGTEPSDPTIGRYLAGFMAELSSPDEKNWIETKVEPGRSAAGEMVSVCRLDAQA